jgi:hypothetical protein
MPYIPPEERAHLEDHAGRLGTSILTPGQLNFVITKIVLGYLGESPRYTDYAAVHGVLGDVWEELRERRVKAYERRRRTENGDVYS